MNKFYTAYQTNIGIKKNSNQDSLMLKGIQNETEETILAVLCDGMGGMAKGELASATVVTAFSDWLEEQYVQKGDKWKADDIREQWQQVLSVANRKLLLYGSNTNIELGTTATIVLLRQDGSYVIGHVGDTRVYHLAEYIRQLTEDHTFVAREVQRGRMTQEQAANDNRRNVLLQCIGVNEFFEMQFLKGHIEKGEALLLCSDGFRHVVTEKEIFGKLNPKYIGDENVIRDKLHNLILLNIQRKETDNISAVYIKMR